MTDTRVRKGILLMLCGSAAFAVMAACAKGCAGLPASQTVFVRSLAATVILVIWMRLRRVPLVSREPALLYARSLIGFTAMMTYFWTLTRLDLGTAVMLNYTAPLFAVVLARFILRERTSSGGGLAILAAFAGVCLLTGPRWAAHPLPILAGLSAGLLAGTVHILIRNTSKDESPLTIILYFTVASSVGSGLLLLWSGPVQPTLREGLLLAGVTVSSLIGQIGLTYSLRIAPVPTVSPFGYITPVLSFVMGWLLWAEPLSAASILGSFLIISAGIALYRLKKQAPPSLPAE